MDLIASLRFLSRRKIVASVAIVTIALALGANTASFAVLRGFLFSALGVPEPDRLVNIAPERELPGRGRVPFSDAYVNYILLRETQTAFADVTCFLQNIASWNTGDEARPLQAAVATASFFSTMRVSPMLGRAFTAAEEGPSAAPVVVISHALWNGELAADSLVLGRTVQINGKPITIIGVMPEGFAQPVGTDVWLPFEIPALQRTTITGARVLTVFGRIADGKSPAAATLDIETFTRRAQDASADNREYVYALRTLRALLLDGADATVLLVQGGAVVLLLLAMLNLSALLVAWGVERRAEFAVRVALGGSRVRVLRLLLIQSAIVATAGLVLAVIVAHFALVSVRQLALGPTLAPFLANLKLDPALLVQSGIVAVVIALVAGSLPLWMGSTADTVIALRGSRSTSQSRSALRSQKMMVAGQAALSVVVLGAAAAIGVSFRNLSNVPGGFTTANRVVARLILPDAAYGTHASRVAFSAALLDALSQQPDLSGHAFTTTLPVSDQRFGARFHIPDAQGAVSGEPALLHFRRVSPQYLRLMQIPLIRGRHFEARDDSAGTPVAIVSAAVAAQYWSNEDPVGKRLVRVAGGSSTTIEVIGVAGDVMDAGFNTPPGQAVYVPYSQVSIGRLSIVAEGRTGAEAAFGAVRRALRAADPRIAATGTTTLDALVSEANALPRLRAVILVAFATLALAIAALGSYGVMRQLAASREREFAIRLVFGARPGELGRAVLVQVWRLTLPGVVFGLAGSWWLASTLQTFVFGVDPRSGWLLALVGLGVLGLAGLTAMPSAMRALRVDVRSVGAS